jgi:hypothetical protein
MADCGVIAVYQRHVAKIGWCCYHQLPAFVHDKAGRRRISKSFSTGGNGDSGNLPRTVRLSKRVGMVLKDRIQVFLRIGWFSRINYVREK